MKILFPVDGSEYSVHAAHVIARRAELQNFNPEVCVLNVQKAAELMIPALKLRRSAATNRQSEAAFKKVRDILKNVKTEEKVVIGNPAQVIAEEADREKADLIVMGSRGLSDFAKLFLGSVSTAVLARTTVPVMLIRSEYTSEPGKELKVCVAVDGSPYSEAAARYIVAHREMFGEKPDVRVVTVVDVAEAIAYEYPTDVPLPEIPAEREAAEKNMDEIQQLIPEIEEKGKKEAMSTIRPIFVQANFPVTEVALTGDPGTEIANYAKTEKLDLVIMGTRGRDNVASVILGSVTSRVAADGSVPLLVIPA
mgnify:FL=1|jgi:nucleotide-binding universal stress UspA family protein